MLKGLNLAFGVSIDTRNTASLREKQIRINNMIYLETRLLKTATKIFLQIFGNARPGGAQVFPDIVLKMKFPREEIV